MKIKKMYVEHEEEEVEEFVFKIDNKICSIAIDTIVFFMTSSVIVKPPTFPYKISTPINYYEVIISKKGLLTNKFKNKE